ncbi:COMM domain-containing protein, putative, partial [Pediculus humanus corporis]
MSSIKVKMLGQIVLKFLTGDEFNEEKATKLVSDAKLDEDDMKGCVAAISQIFTSSARYGIEEDVLNNELQQLGLPKEHATALGKVYNENNNNLTEILSKKSLRTSVLEDVNCDISNVENEKSNSI